MIRVFVPAIIFTIFLLLAASFTGAQSDIANFVFTTEAQIIAPETSSEEITLEAQDAAGNPVKGNTVCLEFTSSSATGNFSTNETWAESFKILILTLGTNQYRRNLFFKDSSIGIHTISVRAMSRPEGKTCPSLLPEEWSNQWIATQQITVSQQTEQGSSAESSATTSTSAPASSVAEPIFVYPSIKADAGENKTVIAGSLVEFKGRALGTKDEPLENVRFWWNFGDGATAEGRAALHTFSIPGTYTAGLHVSTGEYAASDYIAVSVIPNQLQISSVISGEDGYVQITNNGKTEIDLGGWILEDSSGKNFVAPVKTKIGQQAKVSFLNSVTGLFLKGGSSLVIRYPNSREAVRWSQAEKQLLSAPAVGAPAPVHSASVNAAVSENEPIENKEYAKEDDAVREDLPVSEELAGAATGAGSSGLFFGIALAISVAASIGFMVIKKFFA